MAEPIHVDGASCGNTFSRIVNITVFKVEGVPKGLLGFPNVYVKMTPDVPCQGGVLGTAFQGLSRTRTLTSDDGNYQWNESHVMMCMPQKGSRVVFEVFEKGALWDSPYGKAIVTFDSQLHEDESKAQKSFKKTGMIIAEIDAGSKGGGRIYYQISTMGATTPFQMTTA